MEIWVLILSALCYIVAVSAQNDAGGSDPFAGNQYMITYNELKMCSIPSSKMFTREVDASGTPIASTFDAFCYHQAQKDSLAHFMCLYYRQIIEAYFKDYCELEDGNPLKKPLDESTQYQNFASSPENVSTYLASTFRAQGDKLVFKTAEECLQFCHQTKQSMEFCTNFGFILSIASKEQQSAPPQQHSAPLGDMMTPAGDAPFGDDDVQEEVEVDEFEEELPDGTIRKVIRKRIKRSTVQMVPIEVDPADLPPGGTHNIVVHKKVTKNTVVRDGEEVETSENVDTEIEQDGIVTDAADLRDDLQQLVDQFLADGTVEGAHVISDEQEVVDESDI